MCPTSADFCKPWVRRHEGSLHHHQAQRLLRELHPGYHHDDNPYLDAGRVEQHLADAKHRASIINEAARSLGEPYRNPTTCFSDLLDKLAALR